MDKQDSISPSADVHRRYQLRGTVEGHELFFDLFPGTYRVGSSASSDLHLPYDGVSREHAMLRITSSSLTLEDRGSKNGTFIDQSPIHRAALDDNSTVAFGPIELFLKVIEGDDAELGLVLGPTSLPRETTGFESRDTRTVEHDAPGDPFERGWWAALEPFVANLAADQTSEALACLLEGCGATAACALEQGAAGEPVVLTSCGPLRPISKGLTLRGEHTSPWTYIFDQETSSATLWLRDPESSLGSRALGLVLWDGELDRGSGGERLRPFLRLLAVHLGRRAADDSTVAASSREPALSEAQGLNFPPGIYRGRDAPTRFLYRQLQTALRDDAPVLLLGETGVGKEHLARTLHLSSRRRRQPMVAFNCAAIPTDLLEAELFGIGKGVATGVDARKGMMREAAGGTLFLDEIGDMPLVLQAKLLRVLQERQIQPLGGSPESIDVRIVAATNVDLSERMAAGTFRADLYYRLAGHLLEVPPLRRRGEDLPGLIEHLLRAACETAGIEVRGVTVKALEEMLAHPWPGNVRELEHVIRRAVGHCRNGGVLDSQKLSLGPAGLSSREGTTEGRESGFEDLALKPRLQQLEETLIRTALERSEGRRNRAAELLGISRNGLADKLRRLSIDVKDFRPARP